MTKPEQASLENIRIKQGTMEANQKNMADDIQEMKADIKEIKNLIRDTDAKYDFYLRESDGKFVKQSSVKWYVGLGISITTFIFLLWDHLTKR